jgi:hypothetical protein
MRFENLVFKKTTMPNGIQSVVQFGDYELSVVKNDMSYGNEQGKYEIAVFNDVNQVELPGITDEGNTVKGWLTEQEVSAIMTKMFTITGRVPVQKQG